MKNFFFTIVFLSLFNNATSAQTNAALLDRIGWVTNPQAANLCGGYYLTPNLNPENKPVLAPKESETVISADYGTLANKEWSTLAGNVVVLQPGRRLTADSAAIYRDPATGKIETIKLKGHVYVYEQGRLIVSDSAFLNLSEKKGNLQNALYRIEVRKKEVAWGTALSLDQINPSITDLKNATYSTCAPNNIVWQIRARDIELNKETGRGQAKHARLYIHNYPILYTPYISFPIDKRRKTGFLTPIISINNNESGVGLGFPFYWNLAPNYDATITPVIYSKRGLLTHAVLRYLTPLSSGGFNVGFIPADQGFKKFKHDALNDYPYAFGLPPLERASLNRYMYGFNDRTSFSPHWFSVISVAGVSDDYYFQDFGGSPSLISENQLLQQASLNYTDDYWDFIGRLERYQTLHPVNRVEVANIYSRLPQLVLNGDFPDALWKFEVSLQTEGVYFARGMGPGDVLPPPRGGRVKLQPGISLPLNWLWGYVSPAINLQSVSYALSNLAPSSAFNALNPLPPINETGSFDIQNQTTLSPSGLSRNLPIIDMDSGLYFDRSTSLGSVGYTQTLEPRLFYLYVPYVNQNNIPIFDTGVIPFTYEQLFSTNRFSGYDRLGDANQVSLALTTRLIEDQSGLEKITASIGEMLYFQNRRVNLCTLPGCTDVYSGIGATSNTEKLSPIAGQLIYYLNQQWNIRSDLAFDPSLSALITTNVSLQFRPLPLIPNRLVNFGYSFLRNGDIVPTIPLGNAKNHLNQITSSIAWPLSKKWSSVGVFNYNISHGHPQTVLLGAQYDSCCWTLRLVAGRVFTALDQLGRPTYNNAFYLQVQLKGLSNFGSGQGSQILAGTIAGYRDPFANPL